MKILKLAMAAGAALVLVTAPATAQLLGSAATEFVDAVRKSDGNKVNELLESYPTGLVDSRDLEGNTALTIAIARRDVDFTAFLLNHGADPNLAGRGGDTPLLIAARAGFAEAVEWLLGTGAKVDATNRRGETALIAAVQQRSAPVAKLLLEAGANPDKTDAAQGYSARDYATRDPRARDILTLIQNAKKPVPKKASEKVEDFRL